MRLLYAEDEIEMSEAVADILRYHNYTVETVYNGTDALYYALNSEYDGIILDIMMPGLSGIEVLKKLRESGCKTAIMLLTAKSEVEDKIAGLDLGADDYLQKPFVMGELLARVRAMLRRRADYTPTLLTCGNVTLNPITFEMTVSGKKAELTRLEYQLMEQFMLNQKIYLTTDRLFEKVWGLDSDADVGIVWVYISYLRKHLDKLGADVEIKAKRNIGYTLESKL